MNTSPLTAAASLSSNTLAETVDLISSIDDALRQGVAALITDLADATLKPAMRLRIVRALLDLRKQFMTKQPAPASAPSASSHPSSSPAQAPDERTTDATSATQTAAPPTPHPSPLPTPAPAIASHPTTQAPRAGRHVPASPGNLTNRASAAEPRETASLVALK